MMSIRKRRIDELLAYFEFSRPLHEKEYDLLLQIGTIVARAICTEPNFRENSGVKELTAPGLSMAVDMGLLVADLIIDSSNGAVTWILLKSPRSDLSYNLPVLRGRSPRMILDPIRGSITESNAILNGTKLGNVWARTYEFWLDRLMGEGGPQGAPNGPGER
jgi:hypothetical protein